MKLMQAGYRRPATILHWLSKLRKIASTIAYISLAVPILMAAGCNDNTSSPAPFFPVQKDAQLDQMAALAEGKLVLDNGYLRLIRDFINSSDSAFLVWPHGFSLRVKGEEIQVIDNNNQSVARVGDRIKVGGGEVSAKIVEEYIGQPLPDDCTGPYWIVSEVIVIQN